MDGHRLAAQVGTACIHRVNQGTTSVAAKSTEKKGLVVEVRGNNIEKAIRVLNRKVKMEGIIREVRQRQYYEKPSVKKRRKLAEAQRRAARTARTVVD